MTGEPAGDRSHPLSNGTFRRRLQAVNGNGLAFEILADRKTHRAQLWD